MDMGWHTTPHWGSLDWNRSLIPHPAQLLSWLHQRDIRVTLNWHPNDGVGPWYSRYDQFCRALGLDPSAQKTIPFQDTNEKFMRAYYKILMNPLEEQGVDFWWLDGGIHLGWDNSMDFWNIGRPSTGKRGASFSRWGGWGNQRYPVSFSGDTSSFWRVLRFEIPFTAAGGNVGADYWSNDVAGFRVKIPSSELFTRWVQFGALSPVFRTHGEDEFGNFRIPWYYGSQAESASRRAYDLRAQLLPYIYTTAYLTSKTSLPLVRPLYLDYPKASQAYDHPEEYQFGPDLLVSPIVHRGIGRAWLGAADVWFPSGTWWNLLTDESVSGPGDQPVLATASEIPVFVRGGVPLPMQPVSLRPTAQPANPLIIRIYPGPGGHFTLYEDDGASPDYLHGAYSLTSLDYQNLGDKGGRVLIGAARGSYQGQPQSRRVVIELPATTHPAEIEVDGKPIPESGSALPGYSYNSVTATSEIRLPNTPIRQQIAVTVRFSGSQAQQEMIPQILNRIALTRRARAGAGQTQASWKYSLNWLLLNLQTLLAEASQSSPEPLTQLQTQFQQDENNLIQIQSALQSFKRRQARAAAFALSNDYLDASVRLRKEAAGVFAQDTPRDRKPFNAPNDLSGYRTGLLIHALLTASSPEDRLAIHIPGLAYQGFELPQGGNSFYAFLPFAESVDHPIYHLRGTIDLASVSNGKPIQLSRSVSIDHSLLDQWNLVGPFPQGQAPALGSTSITSATLRRTYPGVGGKTVRWQSWRAATASEQYERAADYLGMRKRWIDLHTIYPASHSSALAVTWIRAPKAVAATMSVRHDSAIAVWINRQKALDSSQSVGVIDIGHPSPERITVHLKQGWNQILVNTSAGLKDWGFAVRVHLPFGVACAQSDEPPAAAAIR